MAHVTIEKIKNEVKGRGLNAVARDLGMSRFALASCLLEVARPGSIELLAKRYAERERAQGGAL